MTRIWGHFVILDVCECVILRLQIMLSFTAFEIQFKIQDLRLYYSTAQLLFDDFLQFFDMIHIFCKTKTQKCCRQNNTFQDKKVMGDEHHIF